METLHKEDDWEDQSAYYKTSFPGPRRKVPLTVRYLSKIQKLCFPTPRISWNLSYKIRTRVKWFYSLYSLALVIFDVQSRDEEES